MKTAAFWSGAGAGAVAGAAIGILVVSRQNAMRTGLGRAMKKMGNAMDAAVYDIRNAMQ